MPPRLSINRFSDLRLWARQSGRAGSKQAHDSGSSNAVLQSPRDPYGSKALLGRSWRMECRLHLRWTSRPKDSIPSSKSGPAGEPSVSTRSNIVTTDPETHYNTILLFLQLELITELLGTPTLEDMKYACEGARSHMLRRAPKLASLTALYTLSSQATHEAVHLLCQMLVFDPVSKLLVVINLSILYTRLIFDHVLRRIRGSRWSTHWLTHTSTKEDSATIPACVLAVIRQVPEWDSTRVTLSPRRRTPSTICGKENSPVCSRWKVR